MTALARRVMRHPDAIAATRLCADLGLSWGIEKARGKGHPKLVISDGERIARYSLSSSPGHQNMAQVRASLARFLKQHGFIKGDAE